MKHIITLILVLAYFINVNAQDNEYTYDIPSEEVTIVADFPSIEIVSSNNGNMNVEVIATLNGVPIPDMVALNWDARKAKLNSNTDHDKAKKYRAEIIGNDPESNCNYYYETRLIVAIPTQIKQLNIRTRHGSILSKTLPTSVVNVDFNSVHGSIDLKMGNLVPKGEVDVHSTHGHVDVSVPEKSKANVFIRTDFGEIFSDMDLVFEKKRSGMRHLSKSTVKATINGGGSPITMTSDHSDLFLRKH